MNVHCPTCGSKFEYFESAGYAEGQILAHCHECQRDWLIAVSVSALGTRLRTDVTLTQYWGRCSCCGS